MRLILLVALVWTLVGILPLQSAPKKTPDFEVRRPTIVAFFPPVTDAEMKEGDTNEALADFQFYAVQVRQPLRKAGIDFHEVYARSFRVRAGKTVTTFRPVKVDVGYYLIAPGKQPRVEYGVMTDADLLQVANEYFGVAAK